MSERHPPSPSAEPVRLGTLEQQVMDIVWENGALTIREIIDLSPGSPAYTTIATVLRNLERKRMVTPIRRRRGVRFKAVHDREQHAAQLMQHALNAPGTNRESSMLHFVETLSPDDVDVLRRYLADHSEDRPDAR
ncbi:MULTISPECIES: BlaI/MecI/CopY family transcriptional regulator [Gordonia]|uniref:BlaI/MecI/CopY family transcriptional regulator n=1 Tax=Gordonia oleivorans TaxID=3156618 RepID=UPI0032B46A14